MGIIAIFIAFIANFLYMTIRYIIAAVKVQQIVVSNNPFYILIWMLLPAVWWVYSTKEDFWNFYNRKNFMLRFVIVNDLMVMAQAVWTLIFDVFVFRICQIPVKRNFNKDMVLNLCRIALVGGVAALIFGLYSIANKILETDEMKENINSFRYQHLFDTRKNKETLYDLSIMKNMETGAKVIFKEVDRFVHMFILGNSGTGKTSSTITPSVICDLDRKMDNKIHRQALLQKMIKEKKAYVTYPPYGDDINEYCIKAYEGHEKELASIRKHFPDCGMTVMAPNASLNMDIIKLAAARGEYVNVIDPANSYDEKNVRVLGLNPFFVPLGLDIYEKQIQISNKAQTFAEVLMAVSEINGTGDQYFRDINTSVTTNIAIMCMLRANLTERQTNIAEIQSCINDFAKLGPIVNQIQSILHMNIKIVDISSKKDKRGAERQDKANEQEQNFGKQEQQADDIEIIPVKSVEEIPQRYIDEGMTVEEYSNMLKEEAYSYYEPIHFVMQELLGAGFERMFDQSRGLRNLVNKLLLDPRIKKILSATEDNFIDWDKALAQNEITVINTALEFGPQGSTALGLFIMLNMKTAIMRRPMNTRSNHFLTIDEASQYMHPMFEDMFALYRQYRVACTIAMQSLSQMEKTPITKYLRGVIMGAGIHVVFGRVNADEMKYYEAMAGIYNQESVQTTVNSNSEFDENYSVSKGQRTTIQQANVLDGYKIRQRNFQEVSVFMIDAGRVKGGFIAKVSFPKSSDYSDRKVTYVDFSKYVTGKSLKKEWEIKAEAERMDSRAIAQKYETGIYNTNMGDRAEFESTLPSIQNSSDIKKIPIPHNEEMRQRMGRSEAYIKQMKDVAQIDVANMKAKQKAEEFSPSESDKKEQEYEEYMETALNPDKPRRQKAETHPYTTKENTTGSQDPTGQVIDDVQIANPLDLNFNQMAQTEEKPSIGTFAAYNNNNTGNDVIDDVDAMEDELDNQEREDI